MIKKMIVGLIIMVCLLLPSAAIGEEAKVTIATIWNAPSIIDANGLEEIDFDQASKVIQWQRQGFLAGLRDAPGNLSLNEIQLSERDDLSEVTSDLADLYNRMDIVMTIGASTEINTMYAALVANFFKIPMLIPFSDGDLLSDINQGYTMRITPTGQQYANYFGTKLLDADLTQRINNILFENKPVPDYTVKTAVFFTDNFNDHELAIKTTERLMDNGIDICYYKSYPERQMLSVIRSAWENDKAQVEDADVVILIAQDKDAIVELGSIVSMWSGQEIPPAFILIGYVPEYTDTAIFNSDNVYVLRQKNDKSNCPAEIAHHEQAMGYAAGYITKLALGKALEIKGPEKKGWRLWLKTEQQKAAAHENYLDSLRTQIVTVMHEMTEEIPCFGKVRFLSADEDRSELELIRYVAVDQSVQVDDSEIFYRIVNRIREQFGITEW